MKRICLLVLLFAVPGMAAADVILFKDGRQIQTRGIWMENGQVKWVGSNQVHGVSRDQVAEIERRPFDSSTSAAENVKTAGRQAKSSGKTALPADDLDRLALPDEAGSAPAAPPKAPEASAAELNRQARLLIKDGRCTDAEKALSLLGQAQILDPGYAETYHNLGQVYMEKKEFDNAVKHYRQGLDLDLKKLGPGHPELAPACYRLGAALHKKKDYDGAIEKYRQALDIIKTHSEITSPAVETLHHNLGLAYSAKNDYAQSRVHYQKALEIFQEKPGADPLETAVICNNLGAVCFKNRDYEAAVRYFQQALDIRQARLGDDHSSVKQVREYLDMARKQMPAGGASSKGR